MTYRETIDFLFGSLPMFQNIGRTAYKANLNNSNEFDNYLVYPHKKYKTIHIAGTNGKGSTSHMLASVLTEAGYKTGLYTSPHLYDFRERIKINGKMISEQEVVEFVSSHKDKIEEINPSFFEMTVFMAFDHFARHDVDIAVIEVGMGGRLDSTNVIIPILSVITNIGIDHTQFLGSTKKQIAGEKAGIIKQGIPVVIGETDPETGPVFTKKAKENNSEIVFADKTFECISHNTFINTQLFEIKSLTDGKISKYTLDLAGGYQRKNLITVLTTVAELNKKTQIIIGEKALHGGLKKASSSTGLNGRWRIMRTDPTVICDTGHNKEGLTETMAQIHEEYPSKKLYIVIGTVNDKDLDGILHILPKQAYYIFTQASIPRAMDAKILANKAAAHGFYGKVISNVNDAVNYALKKATSNDVIYIGGSTFVVAEVDSGLFDS